MNTHDVEQILEAVAGGSLTPAEASQRLARLPFADVGPALIDHHRSLRQGMPEAIYGPGKSPEEVTVIVEELLSAGSGAVILTRCTPEQVSATAKIAARHKVNLASSGPEGAQTCVLRPCPPREGHVTIVTAGTADGPVAEEIEAVLLAMGYSPTLLRDRGVAGIHRLLDDLEPILEADVVIVVAGMEGALASVVGGLARGPVIAVPTSVGYGSSFEGVTALLAMLSSCAAGVTVVGIDNGFGAAMAASRVLGSRS